jgi:murein DD-endopeptidase MepM/ murein hydrolase activator NlpD
MSKILVRRGHVNQGDVIGRVGSTVWQQGLMFVIVLENGKQVDALKLKLPGGEPMKSANKARFKDYRTIEV